MKRRDLASQPHATDSCDAGAAGKDRFVERIALYVEKHMEPRVPALGDVNPIYSVSSDPAKVAPVSLMSNPMCSVTAETLQKTMRKVPAQATIDKANEFTRRYNASREKALRGDRTGRDQLSALWIRTMSCLAYVESLGTADTATSDQLAREHAPADYRRPAGVLFYYDKGQSNPQSALNLGLYQFGAYSTGNTQSCLKQWNQIYPNCKVNTSADKAEMVRILGSAAQTFNAFCGVNKVTQTFHVQANTTAPERTHPSNLTGSGALRSAQDRCVSLHFYKGTAYVHFGPFMDTTGKNLDELLTCALDQ